MGEKRNLCRLPAGKPGERRLSKEVDIDDRL
jgi:hypothetical protein